MIALDPQEAYEFTLTPYRDRPKAQQPTFRARRMTYRERMRYRAALTATAAADVTEEQAAETALAAITPLMLGWRNVYDAQGQAIPFDPAKLPDILTFEEFNELVLQFLTMPEDSRKNSGSPSRSHAAANGEVVSVGDVSVFETRP